MYSTAMLALALLTFYFVTTPYDLNAQAETLDYGGSQFPDGPYSLPAPATGCVEDETRGWAPGYILFRSLVNSSSALLANGAPNWPRFAENMSFLLSFCTKLERQEDSGTVEWPMGHYGVFKAGIDCPPGFIERSDYFQLPEFQSWQSDGELPEIELFPDEFSMKMSTCLKEKSSNGTNRPQFAKAVYLLKDPGFECPTFDGYEVTDEQLALECLPGKNCLNFSMCYVRPNITIDYFITPIVKNPAKRPAFRTYKMAIYNVQTYDSVCFWIRTSNVPVYDLGEWMDLGFSAKCLEALGMADGTITDDQLSASSYFHWTAKPEYGRPGDWGWLPLVNLRQREYDYFQIDLKTVMMIEGIEVQYAAFPSGGAVDLSSDAKVEDSRFWIRYAIAYWNFRRYNDKLLVVTRHFELELLVFKPFAARFVRIEFVLFPYDNLSFELFGCKNDVQLNFHDWKESVLPSMCFDKLGLMDGIIYDFQIMASSWIPEYEPIFARPGLPGWCADLHDPNPYIEVDLVVLTYVQGLILYDIRSIVKPLHNLCSGSPEVIQYMSILVSFSDEPPAFKPYMTQPFSVSTTNATELFFMKRFLARSVRLEIINIDAGQPACLRFEIIGCRFKGSMSVTCSKDATGIWIDDPIILPDTDPIQSYSPLNTRSLEACQEFCLNEMDDRCSTVQFLHGDTCNIYYRSDLHRSKVISPASDVDMWRTRACFMERASVNSIQLDIPTTSYSERYALISTGYPFYYESAIEQVWTVETGVYIYEVELLFTNISLYPPTTNDCVDKIKILDDNDTPFPAITHEYNGAILYVPCHTSRMYIKLMPCQRTYIDEERYYGFRMIVDQRFYSKTVWPQKSSFDIKEASKGLIMYTFSLLGHPLQTLSKDVWKVRVILNTITYMYYFNVPCYQGHQLTVISNNIRHRFCGINRPVWNFGVGELIIEYIYGEPVFAAGFSAHMRSIQDLCEDDSSCYIAQRLGIEGYYWPGECELRWFVCNDTLTCVSPAQVCDGRPDCGDDETEYACNEFLPTACSEKAKRCHSIKEIVGEDEGYWTHRKYTKDCSDLDDRYTLPIIHNEQQMSILRGLIRYICYQDNPQGCYDKVYLDIGLKRYFTEDGIEELWEDGTKVSFTAWKGQRTPSHLCTSLVFDNLENQNFEGYWVNRQCEDSLSSIAVICERRYNQTQQSLIYATPGLSASSCLLFSLHECISGEVVHVAALCDGIVDCSDGSDETDCQVLIGGDCTTEEFACGNGTCIGLHNVCDFKRDCFPDGDDELCEFPECMASEFTCKNKQCIPNYSRCDAVKDCIDGTDEISCETCNETVSFPCEDLTCIHKAFVCDGIYTCKYGRDEANCGSAFSTCFEWWKAGYRKDGRYLLDGVLDVHCSFHPMDDLTTYFITAINLDVYHHEEGFEFNISSMAPYLKIGKGYKSQAEDSKCNIKIKVRCTQNILQMEKYKEISREGMYNLCAEQTIGVWFDLSRDHLITTTDRAIGSIQQVSRDRPDIIIMRPIRKITRYSTVQFTRLNCFKEYTEEESTIGCGDGTVAPMSTRCIYDIGRAGNPIGCPSLSHLANCDDFKCSSVDYVKCPGHFCIPERFVCDGIKQCRDGSDEFDCGCSKKGGQVTIVYIGDASEVKRSYIYKFGRLFLSSGRGVRVVSLDIEDINVIVKSRSIHHSNEALNQAKWKTQNISLTRVTDIISATTESSQQYIIAIHDDDQLDELVFNTSQLSSHEQVSIDAFSVYMKNDMRLSAMKSKEVNGTNIFVKSWDILGSAGPLLIDKCQERGQLSSQCSKHAVASLDYPGRLIPRCLTSTTWKGNKADRCIGKFKCMSSKVCIPLRHVCDGVTQCLFGEDERLCDFYCPTNCSCGNYVINCNAKTLNSTYLYKLPKLVRSLDLSYSQGVFIENKVSFPYSLSVLVRLNISSCAITDIVDNAFEKTKNLLNLDLSYNKLTYITKVMFKGLTKLRHLLIAGNSQLQSLETHAFHDLFNLESLQIVNTRLFEIVPETFAGLRLSTLDISNNLIHKIFDMAFSGLDVVTLKMDRNDASDFGRNIFTDMRNVRTIISPAFKFCCYRPDYVEEKNCFPVEDEFSSCEDLMRNSGLQTLLWVVGVSALVGNCLSIVYRLTVDKVRLKLGYGIFVTNLALSDFLMGLYLLIIAVADLTFRNRYIEVEVEWRASNYCKLAGVLATVSSEASVIFMCLITLDRILVIKFPFGNLRFKPKSALMFSALGWVLAWGIALFPLLYSKLFDGQFYSKSGVCLALPLTSNRAPGWLYSVLIFVGLNFVTFILIAIGQLIIYLDIKKNTERMKRMAPTKQSAPRRNDMVVARNLFLVLSTDFLCWFPIGVMAILALSGYPISGDVYAWTAVTVLPINSALNPILYTVTAILRKKQFNPRPDEQAPRDDGQRSMRKVLLLSRCLFKYSGGDLKSVATLLSDAQWAPRPARALMLARSVVKILHQMHDCQLVHGKLNGDTVFVTSTRLPEVFMNVTPKTCKSEAGKRKDMDDFGHLLHRILN